MIAFGSFEPMLQYDAVSPIALQRAASSPKVGRSVKSRSPFVSVPLVILNGRPENAVMNGFMFIFHGSVKLPPMTTLCLISPDDLPYSPARSYVYAGKLPAPSVSPFEKPSR